MEVELETGRKHQIRVHMAGLGCPVAGDRMYGAATDPARRLCLHAWRLAFDHPFTGARVEVEVAAAYGAGARRGLDARFTFVSHS